MTDLKTLFKKEMHKCVIPGLTECDIRQGLKAKEYFVKRTKEQPYLGVVTGALHGRRVSFEPMQRYVEKIMKIDPKELTHDDVNMKLLKGSQLGNSAAMALADSTRCYLKHCGENGKKCLQDPGRKRLLNCMRNSARYMGLKSYDLTAEYLGDKNAATVDRHIQNWACNIAGLCYIGDKGKEKGVRLTPNQYHAIQDTVKNVAKKCGIPPADAQVPIWFHGACKSRKSGTVWLGEGGTIQCCKNE